MKLAKIFFVILIPALFTQNLFSISAFGAEVSPKKLQVLKEIKPSFAVHYEYHEVEGVMWEFVYGEDGKLIYCHPFE